MDLIYKDVKSLSRDHWVSWVGLFQKERVDESYFPMWLKKQSMNKVCEPYWAELADFDWSLHWVKNNDAPIVSSGSYLMVNPIARIHRFDYAIEEWVRSGSSSPIHKPHVLIVSRKGHRVASFEMAVLLDELGDEPRRKEDLIDSVMRLHPTSKDVATALADLIKLEVVIFEKL
jgi:hypothetical protein